MKSMITPIKDSNDNRHEEITKMLYKTNKQFLDELDSTVELSHILFVKNKQLKDQRHEEITNHLCDDI